MLALCLMLFATYYALNYAGIIGRGLTGMERNSGKGTIFTISHAQWSQFPLYGERQWRFISSYVEKYFDMP